MNAHAKKLSMKIPVGFSGKKLLPSYLFVEVIPQGFVQDSNFMTVISGRILIDPIRDQ